MISVLRRVFQWRCIAAAWSLKRVSGIWLGTTRRTKATALEETEVGQPFLVLRPRGTTLV